MQRLTLSRTRWHLATRYARALLRQMAYSEAYRVMAHVFGRELANRVFDALEN